MVLLCSLIHATSFALFLYIFKPHSPPSYPSGLILGNLFLSAKLHPKKDTPFKVSRTSARVSQSVRTLILILKGVEEDDKAMILMRSS